MTSLNDLQHDLENVSDTVLTDLDADERVRMFLKAAADGQEDRIEMLRDSAPRYEYETRDLEFTHGAIEAFSLSSMANAELERLDNVDEPDPEDVERNQKIKTVLRAIYKNDMTQKEAGDLVGRSQKWVSERKQELVNGEHTHLFDKEESAFLPISENDL